MIGSVVFFFLVLLAALGHVTTTSEIGSWNGIERLFNESGGCQPIQCNYTWTFYSDSRFLLREGVVSGISECDCGANGIAGNYTIVETGLPAKALMLTTNGWSGCLDVEFDAPSFTFKYSDHNDMSGHTGCFSEVEYIPMCNSTLQIEVFSGTCISGDCLTTTTTTTPSPSAAAVEHIELPIVFIILLVIVTVIIM